MNESRRTYEWVMAQISIIDFFRDSAEEPSAFNSEGVYWLMRVLFLSFFLSLSCLFLSLSCLFLSLLASHSAGAGIECFPLSLSHSLPPSSFPHFLCLSFLLSLTLFLSLCLSPSLLKSLSWRRRRRYSSRKSARYSIYNICSSESLLFENLYKAMRLYIFT